MRGTEITQQELADRAGVAKSQMSDWLNDGGRLVGRESVSRIAFALAELYRDVAGQGPAEILNRTRLHRQTRKRKAGRPRSIPDADADSASNQLQFRGPQHIEIILCELLEAVGYKFGDDPSGLIWQRLTSNPNDRVLHVGWYEKYPLAYGANQKPNGIAALATEQIASLLATRVQWHRIELNEIVPQLLSGGIDMMCCEYVGVESIQFDVWTSNPLPRIQVAPVGLAHTAHAPGLVERGFDRDRQIEQSRLNYRKLEFCHTHTPIGEALRSCFLPGVDTKHSSEVKITPLDLSLEASYRFVLDNPVTPEGRVRCLITDSLTLLDAKRLLPDRVSRIPACHTQGCPTFGLCFALHPKEGLSLGRAINRGLEALARMDYFKSIAFPHWSSFIVENEKLVEKIMQEHAAPCEVQGHTDHEVIGTQTPAKLLDARNRDQIVSAHQVGPRQTS